MADHTPKPGNVTHLDSAILVRKSIYEVGNYSARWNNQSYKSNQVIMIMIMCFTTTEVKCYEGKSEPINELSRKIQGPNSHTILGQS